MFKEVFFTGFPGFIGRKLIVRVLEAGGQVNCVVQEHMLVKARQEQGEICTALGLDKDRIQLYTGDISKPRIGLSEEAYQALAAKTTHVFHLAAVYDLAVPESLARQVNVTGTQVINDFCLECPNLQRYVYYSTCYVSGNHVGEFREQDLELGQGFKNHYESTKHAAEVLVRELMPRVPTTIIRPSIVVGDSRTGETIKFDGPYFIMAFAAKFRKLPLPYVGKGRAQINLTPVDYLIDASIALVNNDGTAGKTFQVADPKPYTSKEVYREILFLVTGKRPGWTVPQALISGLHRLGFVRKLTGLERESIIYQSHLVQYSTANTDSVLAGTGISCPDLMDYLPILVKYFITHSQDRERFIPARKNVTGN